jgi:hypothetical protein
MSAVFNLDISLGANCRILERVSVACAPETEHIRENIAEAQSLNIDETGWKSAGNPRWLWVVVSSVAQPRNEVGVKPLNTPLGPFPSIYLLDH